MNGAEALLRTLLDAGIEVCFTNPGTSEMHFVAALDRVEGMRCVLGLFEGVVSGAADGYARIAGKPAATLLHLGPGFGNAIANVHNARKGHVAMLNIVGDHATSHAQYETPLSSDILGLASPVSHWLQSSPTPAHVAADGAEAVAAARSGPGQIATLVLPADVSWGESPTGSAAPVPPQPPRKAHEEAIEAARVALDGSEPGMILLDGHVSDAEFDCAARIAAHTGARLALATFPTRFPWGAGRPVCERVPYLAEFAIDHLKTLRRLVRVGATGPVSFFAYPGLPGLLTPEDCHAVTLAEPHQDRLDALERLAESLGATQTEYPRNPLALPPFPVGAGHARDSNAGDPGRRHGPLLRADVVADVVAALLPEGAILVDEGITGSIEFFPRLRGARPHEWLLQTGGAIGWGLPAALGAAIAAPERKVVCLEGDGSAMYTIQALWTMARERADVTVLLFANRDYAILQLEFQRVGAQRMGSTARGMMHLGDPDIDFVALARSMGVEASRVKNSEEFASAFGQAMNTRGPRLIELAMPPLFS
ncbi:MAG: acetolactate synthase large subunit [Gammaproteobacteria bacterium]